MAISNTIWAEESAAVVRSVLGGEDGPAADIVVLNAAAAIAAAGAAPDLAAGIDVGRESIRSGAAGEALAKLVAISQEG